MTILPAWEKSIPDRWSKRKSVIALLFAVPVLAQSPETLGRTYRDSATPARRKALERFAAGHKDINGSLAHLTLGLVSFDQKQYPDSILHLQAAQSRLPKLADYAAYYLASARLETGDNAAAAQDAASIRAASVHSPFAARAVVIQARALAAAGSAQEAIRLLLERYGDLPQPAAALALAGAYQSAGDLPRAADYYQRVYYEFPAADQANQAAASLAALRDSMGQSYPQPVPSELITRGQKLLGQHEYVRARSEFQALVPQLTGAERDQARVGIGAADYLNGQTAAAYSYLRTLTVSDPEADAERLYYLAECARHLNDDDQIQESIGKLERYAASPWRLKALVAAANRFLVANQHQKYLPLYHAAYESFPDQPQAAACHWRVTWDAYLRRKHDAERLLREHLEKYAGHPSAAAALYFLGRSAESENDPAAARAFYQRLIALFPNYFYGILARDRQAQSKLVAVTPSPKAVQFLDRLAFPPRQPAVPPRPDPSTGLCIERARLLKSAGLPDLAQSELRFGARNGGQPYLLAMELARTTATPHERLHYMKSAAPDYLALAIEDAPRDFWELLFPLPYRNEVLRNARQQNLDPYMVAALIRQESEFNPQALSAKKAYGLTQVEPATGRALARRAGVRRFNNRALFQPAVNLKLGTFYLRALLDQWGGQWEPALASYNAGKSRVIEWQAWNAYQEPAEFVESIPFTETREYVQAVLRNAAVYRQLYSGRDVPDRSKPPGGRPKHSGAVAGTPQSLAEDLMLPFSGKM